MSDSTVENLSSPDIDASVSSNSTTPTQSEIEETPIATINVEESRVSAIDIALDPPPPYPSFPPYIIAMPANTPGPPPSYEECNRFNTPPPSYESLFGRVREVRKRSNGFLDYFRNIIIFLLGSIGCSVMISVTIIIPICMIFIGSMKMNECPAQKFIPIYLVVGGSFGILKSILNLKIFVYRQEDGTIPWHRPLQFSKSINFFLTAWFITGCICVYRVYPPNTTDKRSSNYCDGILYAFTFWLVTSVYIAFGLLTTCMCCLSLITEMFLHGTINASEV